MNPQAVVAVILTIGVVVTLVTPGLRTLLHPEADPLASTPEIISHWKDVMNVIIGALAGYITGKTERKP